MVQGATNGDLLRRLFSVFPVPDVALFIDVDPRVAAQRVVRRGREHNSLSLDFLTRLREGYLSLPEMKQFHLVSGDADPDTVTDEAWQLVQPQIPSLSAIASSSGSRSNAPLLSLPRRRRSTRSVYPFLQREVFSPATASWLRHTDQRLPNR